MARSPEPAAPPASSVDRERRRAAFLDAATAVFAEHGYDAATTRAIAARAGCAEGLIHRYFGGKRGLLLAILEDRAARLATRFDADFPDRDDLVTQVRDLMLRPLDSMWEHRDFMRVVMQQAMQDPAIGRQIATTLHQQRARLITEKLERLRAAGRLSPEADIAAAAETVAWLAHALGFYAQSVLGIDRETVRASAAAAAALIAAGLLTPATATGNPEPARTEEAP